MKISCQKAQLIKIINTVQKAVSSKSIMPILECIKIEAEGNGNIYPCDFYCTDEYFLGNILETDFNTMEKSKTARDFIKESLKIPEKCKKCNVFGLCRAGGCKRTQLSEDYCIAYKRFFTSCLPLFRVFINEKPWSV